MEQKIAAIAAFGVTITASAVANNSTWPFVSVDQFQQRSASSRSLSGSYFLQMAPIITDDTRVAWEQYSYENRGWLTEARLYQAENGLGLDNGEPVPTLNTTLIYPTIVRLGDEATTLYVDPGVSKNEECWSHKTLCLKLTSIPFFRPSRDHTILFGSPLLSYLHLYFWSISTLECFLTTRSTSMCRQPLDKFLLAGLIPLLLGVFPTVTPPQDCTQTF
jgi:hypothetical protein